jgi:hypothetical protein
MYELEATTHYDNSLGDGPHVGKRHNVILTNSPFGTRGAGGAPSRDNFLSVHQRKTRQLPMYSLVLAYVRTMVQALYV